MFLPLFGFVIYAFVGRKLPENKLFPLKSKTRLELDQIMEHQRNELKETTLTAADQVVKDSAGMVQFFSRTDYAFLTRRNNVKIITDGHALFEDMFAEIKKAQNIFTLSFIQFMTTKSEMICESC